jgi:hypothetical protein
MVFTDCNAGITRLSRQNSAKSQRFDEGVIRLYVGSFGGKYRTIAE